MLAGGLPQWFLGALVAAASLSGSSVEAPGRSYFSMREGSLSQVSTSGPAVVGSCGPPVRASGTGVRAEDPAWLNRLSPNWLLMKFAARRKTLRCFCLGPALVSPTPVSLRGFRPSRGVLRWAGPAGVSRGYSLLPVFPCHPPPASRLGSARNKGWEGRSGDSCMTLHLVSTYMKP